MNLNFFSAACNVVGTLVLVFYPFNTVAYIEGYEVKSWTSDKKISGLKLQFQKYAPRFGFTLMMIGSGIQCYTTIN